MTTSHRPLVVGLAGAYCAGKSTIATWLSSQGAWRIDVDSLGHLAREQSMGTLVGRFGELARDRKALGRLVFADPQALADLEAIVHPVMDQMVLDRIAERRQELEANVQPIPGGGGFNQLILVDAALLFKNHFDAHCDLSLWVEAPWILRLWRGLRRDRRGLWATLALMSRQDGLGPQPSAKNADIFRVRNLGRQLAFARVASILERYHGK